MRNKIESVKKLIVDTPLYAEEIVNILQCQFKDDGVEVTSFKVDSLEKDTVTVNGYFNHLDWELHENIELVLIVPDDKTTITINSDSWKFLQHQIHQTLEHEMIHREQFTKREGLVGRTVIPVFPEGMNSEQERIIYLSDPDEIDAYANDVLLDLSKIYNSQGVALKLTTYSTITVEESPIMNEYMDLFGKDSSIVKTIVKKALKRVVL